MTKKSILSVPPFLKEGGRVSKTEDISPKKGSTVVLDRRGVTSLPRLRKRDSLY